MCKPMRGVSRARELSRWSQVTSRLAIPLRNTRGRLHRSANTILDLPLRRLEFASYEFLQTPMHTEIPHEGLFASTHICMWWWKIHHVKNLVEGLGRSSPMPRGMLREGHSV